MKPTQGQAEWAKSQQIFHIFHLIVGAQIKQATTLEGFPQITTLNQCNLHKKENIKKIHQKHNRHKNHLSIFTDPLNSFLFLCPVLIKSLE